MDRSERFYVIDRMLNDRKLVTRIFEITANATLRRRRLRIKYTARSTDQVSDRIVSPQRLVHYRDNWYLDAWCHWRNDLRKFSLDAIGSAELLPDKAKPIDLGTLEGKLGNGYGIFSGDAVEWAKLRFTPSRARWVAKEQWHAEQRGCTSSSTQEFNSARLREPICLVPGLGLA